ncbi:hypothetical protein [Streptomyces sp. NBC_00932]|uniref:hypothetical protein n=1 Tax=Streptomyces sp. NBC_00932 TaxID=2903690 RepID=UPI00386D4F5B|nr:hypothetical protein OG221_27575 [Streptomyces sp. NBC_00932]
MSPRRWWRRRTIAPITPTALELELYLAALRRMEAALDAAIDEDAAAVDTRPGTDRAALDICEALYAQPDATRRLSKGDQ